VVTLRNQAKQEQVVRLAALYSGDQELFHRAFETARHRNDQFPASSLPKLAEDLLRREGTDVKAEEMQKLMQDIVDYQARFSSMLQDVEEAVGTDESKRPLLDYAKHRLGHKPTYAGEVLYNLVAKGHLSVDKFVRIVSAEFEAQQEIKEARAAAQREALTPVTPVS
jgi:hypothetical protein